MRLTVDPETGSEYPNAQAIASWRLIIAQHLGRPGRPRVLKGEDGEPMVIPADATEEQIAQLIADSDIDISERRVLARALDAGSKPLFEREIDVIVDDGEEGPLVPGNIGDETVQASMRALVEGMKVLSSTVDRLAASNERMAESMAGRAIELEQQQDDNDKLDKGISAITALLQSKGADDKPKDVSPSESKGGA